MRKVRVKHKKMLRGKLCGYCVEYTDGTIEIAISEYKANNALYYFQTFMHECLHWSFWLMKKKFKTKISIAKEHKLIAIMEKALAMIFADELLTPKKKFKRLVQQDNE